MKRNIILNLAISLDGYIVDKNGGFEWIHGQVDTGLDTEEQFDFPTFIDSVDVLVMGRTSYEDIGVDDYKDKKIIVATTKNMNNHDNIEFVSENIVEYLLKEREQNGKDIWLFGGSSLTDNFVKANAVDKYIIGIIPVLLGDGKPLFYDDSPTIELHLDRYTMQDGIPILEYSKR